MVLFSTQGVYRGIGGLHGCLFPSRQGGAPWAPWPSEFLCWIPVEFSPSESIKNDVSGVQQFSEVDFWVPYFPLSGEKDRRTVDDLFFWRAFYFHATIGIRFWCWMVSSLRHEALPLPFHHRPSYSIHVAVICTYMLTIISDTWKCICIYICSMHEFHEKNNWSTYQLVDFSKLSIVDIVYYKSRVSTIKKKLLIGIAILSQLQLWDDMGTYQFLVDGDLSIASWSFVGKVLVVSYHRISLDNMSCFSIPRRMEDSIPIL